MYNRKITKIVVVILFATYTILANADSTASLLAINNPVANQILIPGQQVIVKYTVNGVPQSK